MLPTRRLGELIVWRSELVPVGLWLVVGPEAPVGQRGAGAWPVLAVGQVAGLVEMALLSVSFVLSARLRGLEDYFGGLDGMYRTHHRVGLVASGLLLAHPVPLRSRCGLCPQSGGGRSRFWGRATPAGPWTSACTPSGA